MSLVSSKRCLKKVSLACNHKSQRNKSSLHFAFQMELHTAGCLVEISSVKICTSAQKNHSLNNFHAPKITTVHWGFTCDQTGSLCLVSTFARTVGEAEPSSFHSLQVLRLPPTVQLHAHEVNWEIQIWCRHEYKAVKGCWLFNKGPSKEIAYPGCESGVKTVGMESIPSHTQPTQAWGLHQRA